ncbi:MAG: hypothetical protein OSA51_12285 [Octadecabacter sp.]|nr:hypothetical protein [Octadecabacter sp.]
MSVIRDEIRAVLREELAALKGAMPHITTETVRISSSTDLMRFARDILDRASSPEFASKVLGGQIQFALAGIPAVMSSNAIVSSPAKQVGTRLDKKLITERDISELAASTKTVRLPKYARITPLAGDEARRRGIRIERIEG